MSQHSEESKSHKKSAMRPNLLDQAAKYLLMPCDPSNLSILRIFFGLFMVIDIPQERGLMNLFDRWEADMCYFPLFNVLQPLSVEWMHVVYIVMLFGAAGIMLGLFFRVTCVMFLVPYWYIFWLDKAVWNNHSYLYGLFSILLLMTDSNRYWSLDGLLNPQIRNAEIPKWNYLVFRFQIFLVYFFAGIKKMDQDWVSGYSMTGLSRQWVFDPFRYFLSDETIDVVMVHLCGLCFDLFVGFFLIFDKTRIVGILFALAFNGMNSQMFHIGMFSYTMMATLPLFCATNWPKTVFSKLPVFMRSLLPHLEAAQPSSSCLYPEEPEKASKKTNHTPSKSKSLTFGHVTMLLVFASYVAAQLFLPYSHFISKGYNGWTQGLYGYSWDMMVHSWSTQHVRIRVVDHYTGHEIFIRPGAFIGGGRRRHSRWNSHPDMIKQYVTCLAEKIKARPELEINEPEIYLDVWRSMNRRFQQRFVNPNVDLVSADWSPVHNTPWVQPLLMELSPWRTKLKEIQEKQQQTAIGNFSDIVFVADFPGLMLENFLTPDLNTTVSVLHGRVEVEFDGANHTLGPEEELVLPSNTTHVVYTISDTPACWMYVYVNTTIMNNQTLREWIEHPETRPSSQKKAEWNNKTVVEKFGEFSFNKYIVFSTAVWNSYYAVGHLAFGLEYPQEDEGEKEGESNPPGGGESDVEEGSRGEPEASVDSTDSDSQSEASPGHNKAQTEMEGEAAPKSEL